jgi:hypothetical protein
MPAGVKRPKGSSTCSPVSNLPQPLPLRPDGYLYNIERLRAENRKLRKAIHVKNSAIAEIIHWFNDGLENGDWLTYTQTRQLFIRWQATIDFAGFDESPQALEQLFNSAFSSKK